MENNADIISIYNEPEQLNTITIYNNLNQLVRKFDFNYYLVSPNTSSSVNNNYTNTDIERIFLKEVIEYDETLLSSFQKYAFDYYSPQTLPPRHSFSKDIYGYFNNKNNKNLIYKNWSESVDNASFDNYEYNFEIADREPIGGSNGMLHHIYYPTKGKTEFIYEPNIQEQEKTIYPPKKDIDVGFEANAENSQELTSAPFSIPFSQTVLMNGVAELDLYGEGICNEGYPDHWTPTVHVKIINTNTNQTVGSTLVAQPQGEQEVELLAGETYVINIKVNRPCLRGYGRIKYWDELPYNITVDVPVGGARVQKTIDYDNTGGEETKRYYYGNLSDLEQSSFIYSTLPPNYFFNLDILTKTNLIPGSGADNSITGTMYSTSKTPLYDINGSAFSYTSVTESFGGDNFEKGGIVHSFIGGASGNLPGQTCGGDYVRGTPFSNGHNNGKESLTRVFKKENNSYKTVSLTDFDYQQKNIGDFTIGNLSYNIEIIDNGTFNTTSFNVNQYDLTGEAWYLASKEQTVYDINGQNPVATTVNYYYDSPAHLQLSSQTSTNSIGETIKTEYQYPQDLPSDPYSSNLVSANRISQPLVVKTFNGTTQMSEQKTVFGGYTHPGIIHILPQYVYAKKGTNTLEKKVTYDSYDAEGNLTQYTMENGTPVSIIWGYNGQYPIAKVEGKTYTEIASLAGTLITDSNSSWGLQVANFETLRNTTGAIVTCYIYKPLVGVTMIIQPNGQKETYEYDDFGRLMYVKDHNGNILKKIDYNYKD